MMVEQGLLNNLWRDVLALVGVIGFLLTAAGVWLAWVQMRRTATATKAATDAAIAAYEESRTLYNTYVISQAARLLVECQFRIQAADWTSLGIRLDDLIQCLLQLAEHDASLGEIIIQVQEIEKQFVRIPSGRLSYNDKLRKQWTTLYQEMRAKISAKMDPFSRIIHHD